ncbi:MAG TPA: ATP-binding protein [Acidimicrobiales bacterium]|nr:ATP-binding protein [Acidimicrobiales bacterium]
MTQAERARRREAAVTQERRRPPVSIRRLLGRLLAALGLLIGGLFLVTSLQVRGSDLQAQAENRRNESFRLADSMRQSSDDLTLMVRLYVSTGRTAYRDHYDEILAIRSGSAPRPLGYDGSFWDRVLARGKGFVRYGPARSLTDDMRAADFTPAEFDALQSSLDASNGLARLELEVMDRVARRIERGVDASYLADVSPEYQRLVDDHYLAEKGVIMRAVQHFIDLVDQRTLDEVEQARSANRTLFVVQLAILAAVVVVSLASLGLVTRVVLRPLDGLIAATRRFAEGDYGERAGIRSVAELERLAGAFDEMATAIETDVAARERAERAAVDARRAAEDASRAKSSFLAAMSHEIRTPMIGVTGMLEVLARSGLSPQQRHMVGTAQSSASSLLRIIGDVLDLSKIEAGKLEIVPTTFAVRPLVEAAAATFFHTASAKGLLVAWTTDERLAPAHVGDALRIRQILGNFLSNAVKFTDVGGIEVAVEVIDDSPVAQTLEFRVTDTGAGLSAAQQQRLFEEFNQAGTAGQRSGGTGLGLAICRRLAELMGGSVSLASTPGRGTTVRFTVPLPLGDPAEVDPDAVSPAVRQASTRPKPGRAEAEREGSLVLLAEDHPVNRTVLCHQLDIIGFHVDTAPDGRAAFDLYRSGRYGLVLTDLNMPGLDGYGLTAAIRGHEESTGARRTPILALSANVMQGEPERCLAAGMDDFLAKPTTIPFLGAKLRQWLAQLTWPSSAAPEAPEAPAPPGRTADGSAPAIDGAVLDELTGGDPEVASAVLQDFLEASRADVEAIEVALVAGDLEAVRRQAHRVKGASLLVGAATLARLAQQLESLAAEPGADGGEIRRLAGEVAAALVTVEAVVAP